MGKSEESAREAATEILTHCVAGRVHKLVRAIDGKHNAALRAIGLRNTQLTILSVVAYLGRVASTDLAAIILLDKSTLSRNLGVLRRNGWIRVDDVGRGRVVELTADGRAKLHQALPAWREAQRHARQLLGDEAVESLRGIGDTVGVIPPAPGDY